MRCSPTLLTVCAPPCTGTPSGYKPSYLLSGLLAFLRQYIHTADVYETPIICWYVSGAGDRAVNKSPKCLPLRSFGSRGGISQQTPQRTK